MILVDTDIIIDYLRSDKKAIDFIENSAICITYFTELELLAGCSNKEQMKELNDNIY